MVIFIVADKPTRYICAMDYALEIEFQKVVKQLEPDFGPLELDSILFLIGVQELGMGYQKFKKDDKVNLIHIAICTLLEPHGYYTFIGRDKDGWPHFEVVKSLPPLEDKQQEHLIKEAIVEYFVKD